MIMQVLHPCWTDLLENLSALMITLPLVFCAHKQENWLLRVRSAPSPYLYPGAPYSAPYLWSPQVISKHATWGKHRVKKTRFECPHRCGNFLSRNGNSCSIFAFASSCWTGLRLCFTKCKQPTNAFEITNRKGEGGRVIALNGKFVFNSEHIMMKAGKTLQNFPWDERWTWL